MNYSSKISLIEKIADWAGINKSFHRSTQDTINCDSKLIASPVEATLIAVGKIENNGKIISKSKREISLRDTIACASFTTELVKGRSIEDSLGISSKLIIDGFNGLPRESQHCAILAVNTLHKAIADYLLKP